MKIFDLNNINKAKVCLALGFFDCLHLGHSELIKSTIAQATECGAMSCAITFKNSPFTLLHSSSKLIFTYDERLRLFENSGIDSVLAIEFTPEFMKKSKDEFLSLLSDTLDLRAIICGHDYRFGAEAQGNTTDLSNYAAKNGIMLNIIPPVTLNNTRISSTAVRNLILKADFTGANEFLGHPYFISSEICRGRGVGRLYDFPTANMVCDDAKLLPPCGVYATQTIINGKKYKSVTNIGDKPTFNEFGFTVETYICDYNGDLYGKTVIVEFVKKLRDIKKFDSPNKLKKQIYTDAQWS